MGIDHMQTDSKPNGDFEYISMNQDVQAIDNKSEKSFETICNEFC